MATAYKILGQVSPNATTETDLYTTPTGSAVVSTLVICNTNSTQTTVRVSISAGGGATATKDYLYYDLVLAGNDTFAATFGITLSTGDKIRVYAADASVAFSVYGQENT